MNSEQNAYFYNQYYTTRFCVINGQAIRINDVDYINRVKRFYQEQKQSNHLNYINQLPQSPLLNSLENTVWRDAAASRASNWPDRIKYNYHYPTPLMDR